jgi:hypothetical protein
MRSNINNLSVLPCRVIVKAQRLEDNVPYSSWVIDTIYTDSFGNASKMISMSKLKKHEFYTAELLESKWQVPHANQDTKYIIAGIKNEITFGIEPKWRRNIVITDSSGEFEPTSLVCYHSRTTSFYQTETIDSFPRFGQKLIYGSGPSDSHIYIELNLVSRTTKARTRIKHTYDSEKYTNIWINF